jgi:aspartate racemase
MTMAKEKIIGIVGGVGPKAGVHLYNEIINLTKANIDQDHLSVALLSYSKYIVDRTAFIEGKININPGKYIAKVIIDLERVGAEVIGIACNTSYTPMIFNEIVSELIKYKCKVHIVNMPFETCLAIKNKYKLAKRIGLLATNGTYKSNLYSNLLESFGFEMVIPSTDFQNNVVHKMIYQPTYGIKANPNKITTKVEDLFSLAIDYYKKYKVDTLILGCTEFSTIIEKLSWKYKKIDFIDSSKVLANALIREALKEC